MTFEAERRYSEGPTGFGWQRAATQCYVVAKITLPPIFGFGKNGFWVRCLKLSIVMSVTAALGGHALFCARVAQTRRDL